MPFTPVLLFLILIPTSFYFASMPITRLVTQSPSPSSLILLVLQPCSNWHLEDHLIISNMTLTSCTMQELMNSTTQWWSHSRYRSKHCPSSIVQDGGDTVLCPITPMWQLLTFQLVLSHSTHHCHTHMTPKIPGTKFHTQTRSKHRHTANAPKFRTTPGYSNPSLSSCFMFMS